MAKHTRRNIVIDVSGHGLGHLGQITPLIQELIVRYPAARMIVRSTHAPPVVRAFVGVDLACEVAAPEATLVMRGPTEVEVGASAEAYRDLHANWNAHLDRETARLEALRPNVLIADIPYLTLAAAKRLDLPAVAICSINWADMYRAYCGTAMSAPAILATIEGAYRSADLFLQPKPHMQMTELANRRSIGPMARIGRNRREEIAARRGLPRDQKLFLVSLGGIAPERRAHLPSIDGVHWLISAGHIAAPGSATEVNRLDLAFIDVLASADAVVTKVGYCLFVEAACNGVGLVSGPRNDWPESEPLIAWAKRNANFAMADPGIEDAEGLRSALSTVLAAPRIKPPAATGAAEACDAIADLMGWS